jgi:hypothetical protein
VLTGAGGGGPGSQNQEGCAQNYCPYGGIPGQPGRVYIQW